MTSSPPSSYTHNHLKSSFRYFCRKIRTISFTTSIISQMGFLLNKQFLTITVLICAILSVSFCQQISATRLLLLDGEQWLQKNPILQSLQRGPVPPVGRGNPCTFIPGRSRGRCTLTEMNFAAASSISS